MSDEGGKDKPKRLLNPVVQVIAGIADPTHPLEDQLRASITFLGEYSSDHGPQPPKIEVLEALRSAHEAIDLAVRAYEQLYLEYTIEKAREVREAISRGQAMAMPKKETAH